jgi:hypothetical protein
MPSPFPGMDPYFEHPARIRVASTTAMSPPPLSRGMMPCGRNGYYAQKGYARKTVSTQAPRRPPR